MVQPVGPSIQPVTFVPIQPIARVGAALVEQTKQALAQAQQPLPLPQTQALTTAVAQAAGRQDGLAPLMADLGQAMETPDLPAPVRAAAAEVLKLQTPLRQDMAAPDVRQAVSQSGLFLEARLATAPERPPGPDLKAALLVLRQVLVQAAPVQTAPTAAASPAPQAAAPPAGAPVPPATPQTAPAAPAGAPAASVAPGAPAATGQAPTALQTSTPQTSASVPSAPQPSAAQASTAQASTPQTASPAAAGPPAPANTPAALAAAVPGPPPPPATAPAPGAAPAAAAAAAAATATTAADASGDEALAALPLRGPAPSPATNPPTATPAATTLAALTAKAPGLPPAQALPLPPLPAAVTASASAAAGAVAARDGLPPPYRGGPVRAQRAAAPTLPAGAGAPAVTASLLKQTDAALAREELLQAASMPEGPRRAEADREAGRSEPARWMLDIPLTTPQGPAVAQMEISRDGRAPGSAPTDEPVWRVRFSIDAEPLGPVHAAIVLHGGQAQVGLWAERPDSAVDLRGRMGELTTALSEAADTVEVAVYTGAPPQRAPQTGRLVDQSS